MKIRGDFVTNSSSVSYILTMKEDIINSNIEFYNGNGVAQLLDFTKNKIKSNGQKVIMGNEEIYYMEMSFNDDETIPLAEFSTKEQLFDVDLSEFPDEEIMSLLQWIILDGRFLFGLGATQIKTY
jgi:hypothetical protein